ncbi:NADPH-dependent F420 reductase [Actinophytocola xanthii]|uniref:NADP oxidoreductase n=1 Tax=Actinophytocola xanthii TaxID=1912961 RepID=A0A1Q8CPA7_9PSEU|nr:NAD(P)-binding domain-containing protein [Actinophytocola xanthii]OLF16180.1 NADP oxidoreductase [Actinophytocola xanthii]
MRIGILGTGTLAAGLGTVWTRAGHEVLVGGRSAERAAAAAARMGGPARAVTPAEAVDGRDAVLVAVTWPAARDILHTAGADTGSLAGVPLVDPTNAVEHGVGELLTADGLSAAEHLAGWAPGAHVVKAFHLFPATRWGEDGEPVTVPLAGDDENALRVTAELVRDAGARPAVLGPLRRARQLEEVAGFVIGLAFSGVDPNAAIPRLPTPAGS